MMSFTPPKAPPRFVPTLTDVVRVADGDAAPLLPRSGAPATAASAPSSGTPSVSLPEVGPFVPVAPPPWVDRSAAGATSPSAMVQSVITDEVAAPASYREPPVASPFSPKAEPASFGSAPDTVPPATVTPAAGSAAPVLPHGFEEHLVHRVMQRVDVVLDQRLREAIATVVQEQTRSMVPRLREEVESVVRHAVYEAVAEELSGDRDPSL